MRPAVAPGATGGRSDAAAVPGPARLPLRHALLALVVVAVWGTNFVVIRVALQTLPPLLLALLRFGFVLLPAALFIPRPAVRWRRLAAYGLFIGAGQFGLLYLAIAGQISPGLASLVVQVQVFFTIALAMAADGERLRPVQGLALALALAGLAVIAGHTDASTTPLGLALVLLAALAWAGGNQVARGMGRVDMLGVVVWSSAFALPPLLALTLAFEGWHSVVRGLAAADGAVWLAVAWQALGNSLFGYAAWGWLLARHPAGTVAPLALLVPVFGIGASVAWLGEPLPAWKLAAALLVLLGLALNTLWPRRRPA